jgi:hypothetical protein
MYFEIIKDIDDEFHFNQYKDKEALLKELYIEIKEHGGQLAYDTDSITEFECFPHDQGRVFIKGEVVIPSIKELDID